MNWYIIDNRVPSDIPVLVRWQNSAGEWQICIGIKRNENWSVYLPQEFFAIRSVHDHSLGPGEIFPDQWRPLPDWRND